MKGLLNLADEVKRLRYKVPYYTWNKGIDWIKYGYKMLTVLFEEFFSSILNEIIMKSSASCHTTFISLFNMEQNMVLKTQQDSKHFYELK